MVAERQLARVRIEIHLSREIGDADPPHVMLEQRERHDERHALEPYSSITAASSARASASSAFLK